MFQDTDRFRSVFLFYYVHLLATSTVRDCRFLVSWGIFPSFIYSSSMIFCTSCSVLILFFFVAAGFRLSSLETFIEDPSTLFSSSSEEERISIVSLELDLRFALEEVFATVVVAPRFVLPPPSNTAKRLARNTSLDNATAVDAAVDDGVTLADAVVTTLVPSFLLLPLLQ